MVKKKGVKRKVRTAKKKVVKRKPSKRIIKAKPRKKVKIKRVSKKQEVVIGVITHYFPKVQAAVIKLKAALVTGSVIKIKGHTTDFKQTVGSMQIDRVPINQAKKGQEIGVLVNSRVRQHDTVYKA